MRDDLPDTNHDLMPSLLSRFPVGIAWLDQDLIVRELNLPLQKILNVSPQDVLGQRCSEVFASRTCQAAGQQTAACGNCLELMRQGEPNFFVERSGSGSVLETTLLPVKDTQRRISGVMVLMRDISEIARTEKVLKENEDKYRSVVDNIGIGVAVISPEMRILSLNRQMQHWFPQVDTSRQPVCYQSFNNPPRASICLYCPTRKTLRDGQVHEAVTETPAGNETRNYRIISSPIHDEAGNIVAAIEMVEDCTERKQAEAALAQYRDHLEEMVAERTRELSRINHELQNEILERRRAEEALARNSEKIKVFAYSISHDLRNPAVAIEGLSRLLGKRYHHLLDDRGKGCCDQIARTANQLVELTGKINAFVAASTTTLRFEEVNLQEILRDLRAEFSDQFRDRGIAWVEPEDAPLLWADRLSLLRILRNLVDNSLKYGGQGLSEISFGYSGDGDHHILTIADNGAGLPGQDSDKIFDFFHRQPGPGQTESSGLGLAIVRELAEQHGGGVRAIPNPQGGICFQVTLAKGMVKPKPSPVP